ncbi:MAG: right-handed parallel beta-helix repeat-containing protein [Chloroflexia bacterium]
MSNLRLHDAQGPALVLESSIAVCVNDCYIHDLGATPVGYGILFSNASEDISVTGCHISRVRHGVDAGDHRSGSLAAAGVPRGVSVSNTVVTRSTDAAYTTHVEAEGLSYSACIASNCGSYGFYIRGKNVKVVGCTVEWCKGGVSVGQSAGFGAQSWGQGAQIISNSIRHIKSAAGIQLVQRVWFHC